MNKHIIIDGCNVAECRNLIISDLKKPICKNGGLRGGNRSHLCEDNNDCYFRQIQGLKAENEELQKENKRFAKQLMEYEITITKYAEIINTTKQALEEIKAIAELEVVIFDNKPLFPTNIQRIIDKINEVLKDE